MKKILAVDDSALDRELMIEMLREYDVKNEFLEAKDGEEAIEVLGKNFRDIALILLDWQMPRMSGIEFLEGVAQVPAVSSIPCLYQSGLSDFSSRFISASRRAWSSGLSSAGSTVTGSGCLPVPPRITRPTSPHSMPITMSVLKCLSQNISENI